MTRLVFVWDRDPQAASLRAGQLHQIDDRLRPDNITPRPAHVHTSQHGVTIALLNPTGGEYLKSDAAGLGTWLAGAGDWHLPGGPVPEGTFALVRADADHIEICTDIVASRSVWYVATNEAFFASSSQRALVALLGSFQANRAAFPWMLSSGCLGPGNGWDARLSLAPPDSRVRFSCRTSKVSVVANDTPYADGGTGLPQALEGVFSSLDLDYAQWVLPLSGGADSRGLLWYLPKGDALRAITWGLRAAMGDRLNDAYLARRVAERFGAGFRYFELDAAGVDAAQVLNRFIAIGEGRVAQPAGYIDGFALWKILFDEGVLGIIRGDQMFGGIPVRTEIQARRKRGLTLLTDVLSAHELASLELPKQHLPDVLRRKPGESVAGYRDRLFWRFGHPVIMAALNDLKSAYVELTNPLLYHRLVRAGAALSDTQRNGKRFWQELVQAKCPDIPFAEHVAIPQLSGFLSSPEVVDVFRASLHCADATSYLNKATLQLADASLAAVEQRPAPQQRRPLLLRQTARRLLPARVRQMLQPGRGPKLDATALPFHTYIILASCRLLSADARALDG